MKFQISNFKYQISNKKVRIGNSCQWQAGFSVIEVLLAAALFAIFSTGIIGVVLQGFDANRLGSEQAIANQYASEGIEAARSIKNQSYATLVNSAGSGIARNGLGVWAFSGANNVLSKYARVLTVADVQRDAGGNIVSSGGTIDPNTKKVVSTVSWNVSPTRNNSVDLTTYLTNWRAGIGRGGMLVYGDGGTTTDAIKYRTLDSSTGTWNTALATADIDSATANKALRSAKVYASSTRNEKILLSRHYDGSSQFIYAQVFNGTSWGNVQLLSNWVAGTRLDVQNFDGTYLANGDFMIVYSDNSTTPKFRTWNGTSWSGQVPLQTGLSTPVYIFAHARLGTNEVMMGMTDQGKRTLTEYFNGGSYAQTNWTLHATHASNAPNSTTRLIDFAWSPSLSTTGALVYADAAADKNLTVRIFVANGSGGGAWGTAVNSATAQVNNLGALSVQPKSNASEFQSCDKDAAAIPTIVCRKITFSGNAPTITAPTNSIVAAATDIGIQRSFDVGFEAYSGDPAIMIYSDNTNVPNLKKYTASTSTWDLTATPILTGPFVPGVIKTVRLIPDTTSDDVLSFFTDANLDLYSVQWDGTNSAFYTSPAGKAISQHGLNGSAAADYWYDFVWDEF